MTQTRLKAISTFTDRFSGSYKQLDENDVDFRVYNKEKKLIAYVEVIPCNKSIKDCFPLAISLRKLSHLSAKRLNPVIIWSCLDGIMYAKINEVQGKVKWHGENEYSAELFVFYDKQKLFKYARHY